MDSQKMTSLAKNEKLRVHSIVPVYFERLRKTTYFYAGNTRVREGDMVLVDVARGPNFGKVTGLPMKTISDGREFERLVRVLSLDDLTRIKGHKKLEADAAALCREHASLLRLNMKVVDVEFTANSNKSIFYFTANDRIDFRDLVRELAQHLRMTIEMRQIGARDETKLLGGLGPCGLEVCCATHLTQFAPVGVKMAKNQGLALNPQKVSGICGRLFCCLAYEDKMYSELRKGMPKRDAVIVTPNGSGRVMESDIFRRRVRVYIHGREPEYYNVDDIQIGDRDVREEVIAADAAARDRRAAAMEVQRERQKQFDERRARSTAKAKAREDEREGVEPSPAGQSAAAPSLDVQTADAQRADSPRPPRPERSGDGAPRQGGEGEARPKRRRSRGGRGRKGRGEGQQQPGVAHGPERPPGTEGQPPAAAGPKPQERRADGEAPGDRDPERTKRRRRPRKPASQRNPGGPRPEGAGADRPAGAPPAQGAGLAKPPGPPRSESPAPAKPPAPSKPQGPSTRGSGDS